jgi:hypothetical protein
MSHIIAIQRNIENCKTSVCVCVCVRARAHDACEGWWGERRVWQVCLCHTRMCTHARARARTHTHTHTHTWTSQTLTYFEAVFKNFRILSYLEVLCHMAKNTSWILAQVYLEGEAEPHISFILFVQVIQIYKMTQDIRQLPFRDRKLRGQVIVVIFQIQYMDSFEHTSLYNCTFRFTWYFGGRKPIIVLCPSAISAF